jgi:hypothetical protein
LNFTLSLREVWGMHPREDKQSGFFLSLLEKARLVDIEPVKLSPTWRNFRTGNEEVAKILDRFLISEALLNLGSSFRSGVEVGGISDHRHVSLYWSSGFESPPSPLKFCQSWMAEEDFKNLVLTSWVKLSPLNPVPLMMQFVENLKTLKSAIKKWLPLWKSKRVRFIRDTEESIVEALRKLEESPLSNEKLLELRELEDKRAKWLKTEEHEWRIKSRALWIKEGDNNTKFFHQFANYRRNLNTIWEIKDEEGNVAVSFEDKAKLGVIFFSNLFSAPPGCPIQEIMEVVGKFPTVFSEEMNLSLEEEVTEPELRATLFSMKNGKIPGPDGVTVELFKAFYDHLKNDLLLVVRESQKEGRIHGPLNATFMCLIPKKQCPSSFEDYRPIACCNVIYKLISKIISRRLRPMLSAFIGEEQFGFLHNRQIHDAVSIAQEVLHSVKK